MLNNESNSAVIQWVHHLISCFDRKQGNYNGFDSCLVTLKSQRLHEKTIGHLFYTPRSLVHHFTAICEFKQEWSSRNAEVRTNGQFWSVWPCNLTDDLEQQYDTSSVPPDLCIISWPSVDSNCSHHPETLKSGPDRRLFSRGTFKSNRTNLVRPWKHWASFHSHLGVKTRVIVPRRSNLLWSFWPRTLTYDLDLLYGQCLWQWQNIQDDSMTRILSKSEIDGKIDGQTDGQQRSWGYLFAAKKTVGIYWVGVT